ncbi:MAG: hypothetical protein FWD24_05135, partial [Treponema sp.]|nr:hypothetical protein [Treponema sp.]
IAPDPYFIIRSGKVKEKKTETRYVGIDLGKRTYEMAVVDENDCHLFQEFLPRTTRTIRRLRTLWYKNGTRYLSFIAWYTTYSVPFQLTTPQKSGACYTCEQFLTLLWTYKV